MHDLYAESPGIYQLLGDKWVLACLFEEVCCLVALEGKPQRVLWRTGAASALRGELCAPLTVTEMAKLENGPEPARQALDEASQADAWAAGWAMSLGEVVDRATGSSVGKDVVKRDLTDER